MWRPLLRGIKKTTGVKEKISAGGIAGAIAQLAIMVAKANNVDVPEGMESVLVWGITLLSGWAQGDV